MQPVGETSSDREWLLLPRSRCWTAVIFAVVLLGALAIRVYEIWTPPLDYSTSRPYRSALVARAFYLRSLESAPEMERRVAVSNLASEPQLEVPIMEWMAVAVYRVIGRESLGAARLLPIGFWLIGVLFVFGIARRMASDDAAFVAVLLYLFAPFGIISTRAFQRDPLMVVLMLAAIHGLIRYFEHESWSRLLWAAGAAAASLFIKPLGAFPILATYIALTWHARKTLRSLVSWRTVVFGAVAVLPMAVHTVYGLFIEGTLCEQADRSIVPSLWLRSDFWLGWLRYATQAVGWMSLVGVLVGLGANRHARSRALALALALGYVAFGLVFTVGIHSHGYYQLMLVPIVALLLTPLADRVLGWLHERPRRRTARWTAWILAIVAVAGSAEGYLYERRHFSYGHTVAVRQAIGEQVDHSTRTIILDWGYGKALKYHGFVDGVWWPTTGDRRMDRKLGRPMLSAEERLDRMLQERPADFFIVADLKQYRVQADLRELLTSRYAVVAKTEDFIIFDLRKTPSEQTVPEPDGLTP